MKSVLPHSVDEWRFFPRLHASSPPPKKKILSIAVCLFLCTSYMDCTSYDVPLVVHPQNVQLLNIQLQDIHLQDVQLQNVQITRRPITTNIHFRAVIKETAW